MPFLASLDLFKDDEPLRHDNYNNMLNRHYRTSKIGSFSSNVIFVLLECEDSPNKRLLTFHQEQRIKLPRCDADPCSWDQFVDKYQVSVVLNTRSQILNRMLISSWIKQGRDRVSSCKAI